MEHRVTSTTRYVVDLFPSLRRVPLSLPRSASVKRRCVLRSSPGSQKQESFASRSFLTTATSDITTPSTSRDLGWSRNFANEYLLHEGEVLGEGSFGVVKLAILKSNGEKFAVKILPKNLSQDWKKYSTLLQKEIHHWQLLQQCPQVVDLQGIFEDDDFLYIVQELCTGGDLQHLLKGNVCLCESEAAQIVIPILKMLVECHERNVCFGDVKPSNFMLKYPYPCKRHLVDPSAPRGDLIIKTVDFGCSQQLTEDGKLKKRTGTPLYMAPEILFGWYGVEVDIWALGMMLFQLIGGKLPFFGDHAEHLKKGPTFMIVQAVMESDLEFIGSPWDHVSTELKDLIRGLLDVDYNTRLTAKGALQHPWIKKHLLSDHISIKGPLGNIIKFPGSSGTSVASRGGGNGGSEDGQGGGLQN